MHNNRKLAVEILVKLYSSTVRPWTVTRLSKELNASYAATSKNVTWLEEKNLLKTHKNGRSKVVELTNWKTNG